MTYPRVEELDYEDPRHWQIGRRRSWNFVPGKSPCEIRGCTERAAFLYGYWPRFRVAMCGECHAHLAGPDGVVAGPVLSPPMQVWRTVEEDAEWRASIPLGCCVRGCPGWGIAILGKHLFCEWHSEVFWVWKPIVSSTGGVMTPNDAAADWSDMREVRHVAVRGGRIVVLADGHEL